MRIHLHVPSEARQHVLLDALTERLRRTFARFSNRIARIDVTVTDENGPRGGVDQQCRVCVLLPGIGEIAATAKDENLWAAAAQATRRARRNVLTRLKRPQSQRERSRSRRRGGGDLAVLEPLESGCSGS